MVGFQLRSSYVFRHNKRFRCVKMGYNNSATVRFATSDDQPCSSDFIMLGDSILYNILFTATSNLLHIQKRLYLSSGTL
ncbi:uncharacterized protein Smp_200080 [Schistosoma mansoni]|uniref:uncharacterized protein n=1 Tax=Schistosoma mansoni TaxID=6183 RepID=UPI00022DC159|nr:uncharacterized protein Smp_200080 [Schistosoma mansoni]|eukprot:XP_018649315.1 uncharacterized protein Smp_200080 [Schistosoma mansoni]